MSSNAVGGGGGELRRTQPMNTTVDTGAQINFVHLTPYLIYGTAS
jgi:hypothetical protein